MAKTKGKKNIAIDPNCGRLVDMQNAKFTYLEGEELRYFCSAACKFAYVEGITKHLDNSPEGYHKAIRSHG